MRDENMNTPPIRALTLLGEQFDAAIARVEAAESAPRRVRSWPWPLPQRRLARVAMAAAVACAIGLLVYSLSLDTGHTPSPEEALAEVAATARLQPMPADGQYTYTRALVVDRPLPVDRPDDGDEPPAPGAPQLVTSERRSWVSIDRPGLVISKVLSVRPADPGKPVDAGLRDRMPESETKFEHPRLRAYKFGDRSYTRAEILRIPADPAAIIERLGAETEAESPDQRAFELWQSITQTLTRATAPLPPELRAGLIDALALVPGVRMLDDDVTARGRTGREFALIAQGVEQSIVFDTETADVLRTKMTVVTAAAARNFDQPVDSLLERYELIETTIVDELGAVDAPGVSEE